MNRFLALLMTAILAVALGGCGKDESAKTSTPNTAPTPAKTASAAADATGAPGGPLPGDAKLGLAEGTTYYPAKGWRPGLDPLASQDAIPGGSITTYIGPSPKSLNLYLENSSIAATVFPILYETLLGANPITLEDEPGLASRWAISPDKQTFTFWIDPRAKWSDGLPVTADDVKWTYDTVMNEPLAAPFHVDLERFDEVKVLSDRVIQWHAKTVHWKNLQVAGSLYVLPRHAFQGKVFNQISFDFPVVSGLYRIKDFKENIAITLEKRPDYWDAASPRLKGKYNFQTIQFAFHNARDTAYDSFIKGSIDVFPVYTASRWVKDATGEKIDKGWIVKQKVYTYSPIGFQGFAMNMRRFPFNDRNVRLAICHLINRRRMNSDIMYNSYFLQKSYYEDLYSPKHPCPNKLYEFDKDAARKLLADAGWKANPTTGLLEKDGKTLSFDILSNNPDSEKFLNIMRQDFRDVGIEFKVVQKTWASWMDDMEKFNFDMTWSAWGAGVRKDPEGMWYSKEADRPSSSNTTGFKNAKVDKLIEEQRSIFDIQKRNDIDRQIDQLIYPEAPYALLWNINYTRLLYWNKFGTPPTVLSKYGDDNDVLVYWWNDPDSQADLDYARQHDSALPKRPSEVKFDDVFKP